MTHSSLLKAPPRAANDARNLLIVTLPTLLGLLCLLSLIFLELAVSSALIGSEPTAWIQAIHSSGPGGLWSALTNLN